MTVQQEENKAFNDAWNLLNSIRTMPNTEEAWDWALSQSDVCTQHYEHTLTRDFAANLLQSVMKYREAVMKLKGVQAC